MPSATAHARHHAAATPAPGPPVLMRRLREHTAAVHAATEALPLMETLLSAQPSVSAYRCYLSALYGVYARLEPALYAALPRSLCTELGIAPKLPALLQDMRDLAAGATHAAGCDAAERLPTPSRDAPSLPLLGAANPQRTAAALGGLYVLEGSTLGGQLIARRLKTNWHSQRHSCPQAPRRIPASLPTAFLEFRNHHDAGDWRRFGAVLSDWAAQHPGTEQAVLDGALGTFKMVHAALADAGSEARPGQESTDASAMA